jgi:hypothetical protein
MGDHHLQLVERLHAALKPRAEQTTVEQLVLGLGYTAVLLDDGGVGVAYTWRDASASCSHEHGWAGAEGAPASRLLDLLLAGGGLARSVGMAAANALNHAAAIQLPEDDGPAGSLIRQFGITRGTRVSMVGFFAPVVRDLRELGAELHIVDEARGMGDQDELGERLGEWAEVLILTSTALLGGTADRLLAATAPTTRAALLGPTTPMVPAVFEGTRVGLLGGMVPRDVEGLLRTVRHGGGTRDFSRFCRKVYCVPGQAADGRT